MAYSYFIKQDTYNKFYKNFWTDYFVYQYKASPLKAAKGAFEGEFKVHGSDAVMPYTTWSEYRKRLGEVIGSNYSSNPFIEIYPESVPAEKDSGIPEIESFKAIMKRKKLGIDGGAHFVTWDSRLLKDNPFHLTYRCCKPGLFSRYLKILRYFQRVEERFRTVEVVKCEKIRNALAREGGKTDDISVSNLHYADPDISIDTFRDSLHYYEELGLVEHYGNSKSGEWRLPQTTLANVLGDLLANESLTDALSFFSNILPFGSVGVNLLHRLTSGKASKNEDIFRYKHGFASQALNDYSLIDILYSIENNKWCLVEYRHPIRMELKTFICYPIQIRSSADDGRQYMFCFEPTKHSLRNVRVDQIESIVPISTVSCSSESEYMRRLCKDSETKRITSEELTGLYAEEIENSREWLKYCWGASAFSIGHKIKKPVPKHLKITFSFDPRKEEHIINRLKRERRFGAEPLIDMKRGTATFEIDVLDVKELNKWIKSYFRRVHISSVEPATSAARLMDDFEGELDTYRTHKLLGGIVKDSSGEMKIPDEIKIIKEKGFHHHIFNEFTSDSSEYIMSMIYSPKYPLNHLFKADCGSEIEECTEYFNLHGRPAKTHKEFYVSVLPLLEIEKRWLLSMLSHPLAELFFDKKDINPPKERLARNGVKELIDSDKIYVFGQHCDMDDLLSDGDKKEEYIKNFRLILNAVKRQSIVKVIYKKGKINGLQYPLRLEYSLREKRFRAMCCNAGNGNIYSCNLERFDKVTEATDTSTYTAEKCSTANKRSLLLSKHMIDQRRYVIVRFTDGRNCADRLLNEFSSYRKCCTKNRETGIYTMVLWFDKADSKDIAIRIMSYGGYAEADGDEECSDTVRREIMARLEDQERLNRELAENAKPNQKEKHDEQKGI